MPNKTDGNNICRCSFCGKSADQVQRLIEGPNAYICNECVALCMDLFDDEVECESTQITMSDVPKPKEIHEFLDEYIIRTGCGKESAICCYI